MSITHRLRRLSPRPRPLPRPTFLQRSPLAQRAGLLACLVVATAAAQGCAPEIGDSCSISTDCSSNADRICDTAQPGGYCTIQGCDPDGCPDNAVCVEWRFSPSRTTVTYCMQKCGGSSCGRSGYECVAEDDERLQTDGVSIARVTDLGSRRGAKFCAAVTSASTSALESVSPDASF